MLSLYNVSSQKESYSIEMVYKPDTLDLTQNMGVSCDNG